MAFGRTMDSPAAATELMDLFVHQLRMCNLTADELCVVVTDTGMNPAYAAATMGAAEALGAAAYQMVLPYGDLPPSDALAPAWREADLIVYPCGHALHYNPAMGAALEGGARAMGVMQPFHVLHRLRGDADVVRRTKAGAARLEDAQEIRITSEAGTDLVMDKTGRRALANCGVADEPGTLTFWGAAMVETAQLEGTLEGTLVLDVGDLIFYMGRYIEEPVTITFREGKAVSFEGGFEAFLIRHFLESRGDEGSLMAGHTSWGTDPRALWEAQAIQFGEPAGGADAEAYYGNVQIEIGSNNDVNFRGENEANAHLGLCSLNSSLYLDDELIIDHGEFVPESWRK